MIPVNRPPIPVTLGTADNLEHEANRPANSHEKLGPCVSPNFGPKAGYNMQKLLRKPSTCFSHIPDDGDKPEDGDHYLLTGQTANYPKDPRYADDQANFGGYFEKNPTGSFD